MQPQTKPVRCPAVAMGTTLSIFGVCGVQAGGVVVDAALRVGLTLVLLFSPLSCWNDSTLMFFCSDSHWLHWFFQRRSLLWSESVSRLVLCFHIAQQPPCSRPPRAR